MATAEIEPVPIPKVEEPRIANVPGRLGPLWWNYIQAWFGPPWQRRLARAATLIPRIRHHENQYFQLTDEEIRKLSMKLRGRARGGENLDRMIPEAFALASVAIRRVHGFQAFDVQLAAGIVMHFGGLVELATGEGKTLSAVAPAYLNALPGKGVHVTTVNDYLAKRDAENMAPVFEALGMTVGCIQQKMEDQSRTAQYRCDITYGTASEFGFDFLRDRLKSRSQQVQTSPFWAPWFGGEAKPDPRVQRELYFAIVDEADSIFVDEGRTPLIIANPTRPASEEEQTVYVWADKLARQMQFNEHFRLDLRKEKIELLEAGRYLVRYSKPPIGKNALAMDKLLEAVEKALHAHYRFTRDHQYMISAENKIVIIDEGTGRPMPDRHWRDGLHQAVEAKEGVPIHMQSDHAAQITYQNFYRLYKKLAGMSGTLMPNFREMRRVYRRWVTKIPTNRPVKRVQSRDQVYPNEQEKFAAVVEQIRQMHLAGRPVLVGTRSVEKSEKLSELLVQAGVPHEVLNARQDAREADIIADAGQAGKVTVATNMAGRGTDIKLGEGVAALGGLHVIGTERHEAARIDRQLAGRAGRQGDPGTAQFFLCLEDQILEGFGPGRQRALAALGQRGGKKNWAKFRKLFRKAQKRLERKHYRQRLDLMHYDKQRQEMLQDLGADPYVD